MDLKAVTHNEDAKRFEHGSAHLDYLHRGESVVMTHTDVPKQYEGQGVGSALAKAALDHARSAGWRIVPECPFVATYIRRHPEYQELVAE